MSIDYSNFNMPEGFQVPTALTAVPDKEGISTFEYKKGLVPWRFAMAARPWKEDKIKKYRLKLEDSEPVLLFYRDDKNVVPIKLRKRMKYEERMTHTGATFDKKLMLTKLDLLADSDRLCSEEELNQKLKAISDLDLWELPPGFDTAEFQLGFEKFKAADQEKGTPIHNWVANIAEANGLASLKIFTVEKFGNMQEQDVQALFRNAPPSVKGRFEELHELAVIYVQNQTGFVDVQKFTDKIDAIENANAELREALENKDERIQELLRKISGMEADRPKAKKGNKRRSDSDDDVGVVDGEIKGVQ